MEEKKTAEIIDITDKVEPKEKLSAKLKKKASEKLHKVANWTRNNAEMIKVTAPVIIAVAGGTVKIVSKLASKDRARREKALKDLYCYDRSLGHYWKLSRELKSNEWLEVNQRRKNGESLGSIFSDMNVLK